MELYGMLGGVCKCLVLSLIASLLLRVGSANA